MKLTAYIHTHREDFDTEQPPIGDIDRFMEKVNQSTQSYSLNRIFAVAVSTAAVIACLFASYLFFSNQSNESSKTDLAYKEYPKQPIDKKTYRLPAEWYFN